MSIYLNISDFKKRFTNFSEFVQGMVGQFKGQKACSVTCVVRILKEDFLRSESQCVRSMMYVQVIAVRAK